MEVILRKDKQNKKQLMKKIVNRKIIVVNQATNYLTIGFCNAFAAQFETVALISGSIHV